MLLLLLLGPRCASSLGVWCLVLAGNRISTSFECLGKSQAGENKRKMFVWILMYVWYVCKFRRVGYLPTYLYRVIYGRLGSVGRGLIFDVSFQIRFISRDALILPADLVDL
ncbi:hypothetical protein F4775DRAFT_577802, partial [Biscogniauxia sp. FL1348]